MRSRHRLRSRDDKSDRLRRQYLAEPGGIFEASRRFATDAPEPEQIAARRFATHWERSTGFKPSAGGEPSPGSVNVYIGVAGWRAFPDLIAGQPLNGEGAHILTLPRRDFSSEKALIIAGAIPRATLAAEWLFFERFLGARAYAFDEMTFPKPVHGIPSIDFEYEPPFEYRDTNYRQFLENPRLSNFNNLNGQWSALPERLGGHIGFVHGLRGHGHTFHDFVNPEEYFETHPEYFAEIGGERVKYAQLCLTNDDVLAITIDRARRYLHEAAPNERILSVSQMDYHWFDSWCTCAVCAAVDVAEGSHSGSIIRFVNAVAEALASEFPFARFDTFAYMYSRKPPRLTHPRDNVLVRVCAIETDFSRPFNDSRSPANRAFVRDLKGWLRIAPLVYVWDYTQNWRAFQAPHPNVSVLQPNLAFLHRLGVDGVFEQASPHSPHSDFEALKTYLLGRGLRDPHFDWREEYTAFLNAYYREAAPFIHEYLQLMQKRLRESRRPLYFVNDLEWLDADTVERAQEIFARAFASTRDELALARLSSTYIPVQFAALMCPPRVAQRPDSYVFTRPPSQTLDEYEAMLRSHGVTHLNDYPIDQLRARLKGEAPPRFEAAHIEKLRNNRFELWIVPARGGAVVRWRDLKTGRDWLSGYDNIRSPAGRIHDWATTDPDRWVEPEPLDEPYTVASRSDNSITLETSLDNGLVIRRTLQLLDDALETRIEIRNSSETPVTPNIWYVVDSAIPRAEVWTSEGGRAYSRTKDYWRASDSPARAPATGLALRVRELRRTLAVEVIEGQEVATVSAEREARESHTRVKVKLKSRELASGDTRVLVIEQLLTDRRP